MIITEAESRWIKAGGVNAHYLMAGEKPTVILLHGGGSSADGRAWELSVSPLSAYCRVYAPDLVGYGRSDKPQKEYQIDHFVNFLSDFMEALDLKRASLVGHSLGGQIALSFALEFPERVDRLVLVDSAGFGEVSIRARLLLSVLRLGDRLRGRNSPAVKDRTGQGRRLRERLSELRTPTLIVWGARDRFLPVTQAYAAHELIKNSELSILPKCGHSPQRRRPAELNRLILDFLHRRAVAEDLLAWREG